MHSIAYSRSRVSYTTPIQRQWVKRRGALVVQCVQQQQQQHTTSTAAPDTADTALKQAVLYTKFKAHDAAVTALAVLKDEPGFKQIVTASLDKSLAVWTLEGGDLSGPQLQCSRMEVAGGPVFSLHRGIRTKVTDVNVKPPEPVLFCGLAAKEITALRTDTLALSQQTRMNGHTGWVRSLASSGKYLFSCGCNHLHQWDQAYAVPKEVRSMSLFTGDILALAATDKAVFTAGADGSLRRWALGKLGELSEAEVRDKAHDGRITALAVSGSLLFSAGYDGDIKAWDVSSLQLVMEVKAAHAGERVRALVIGPTQGGSPSSSKASTPSSSAGSSPRSSPAASPAPGMHLEQGEACIEAHQPDCAEAQQQQHTQDSQQELQCFEAQEPQATLQPQADQVQQQEGQAQQPVGPLNELDPVPEPAPPADTLQELDPLPDTTALSADPLTELDPVPEPALPADPLQELDPVPEPAAAADAAAVPGAASEYEPAPAAVEPPAEAPPAPAPPAAPAAPVPAAVAANGSGSPASSRPSSPSHGAVLYSAGDDGLVRRWDARLLLPVGEPLMCHHSAVKSLATGDKELLVSGDAAGEVAVWLL